MAIRVLVEIDWKGKRDKASALANSGFETEKPEILVPWNFVQAKLSLDIKQGKRVTYRAAGGKEIKLVMFEKVTVTVITEDKQSEAVEATLIVSKDEEEVILNDKLIGKLGIVLVKVGEGQWRFMDDSAEKLRESVPKQVFVA